ncbi:MAG TPA: hypothetical protein VNJ53_07985 [Gaiellaceae bacterium]|nr:hypothetical protein [Gaiellaceae bacterium]
MSSELERLLRRGRDVLPEPEGAATERARVRALAALRRRSRRARLVLAGVGAALVLTGFGVGLGALVAPSGEAAKGPVGLGFLPAPGWFAYQTGDEASTLFQTIAVAANVPLASEDVVAGAADPSGLPYQTLLELPSDGIVIVASFTRPDGPRIDAYYPRASLPLRLRNAGPLLHGGTQVRPDEPLGQYQIRASVNGRRVEVVVYFGTPAPSAALRAEAQRQLGRLVVRRGETPERPAARPAAVAAPRPALLDRTFACSPALVGGVRQIDARARRGSGRQSRGWERPALASLGTTVSGSAATAVEDELAWITAGPPSAEATVVSTPVGFTFPFRSWGTVAVNRTLCRASTARVALSSTGLRGGPVGVFDDRWDCAVGRRVLVRIRAVLSSPSTLRTFRGFVRTTVPARSAMLAVQTQAGKRLVHAQVHESGRSSLHVAPGCFPD